MSNALAIALIGAGIFAIYLEQTGKVSAVLGALKGSKGGEAFSDVTTSAPAPSFRGGRTFVTPLGVLNITDAGRI